MKRYGAIILAILFVLGLAATAFAIHAEIPAESQAVIAKGQTQITIGGDIRFRGEFAKNLNDQLDDGKADTHDEGDYEAIYDDHKAVIDQRVRLKLDVKVTDNTSARVHIEEDSTWGEGVDSSDNAKGVYQVGNYWDSDEVNIIEAWINHNFGNVGLKLGHMPLALGNKLFFDHTKEGDDAIVIYGSTSNIHWAGVLAKFNEGSSTSNDDANAYVFLANYKGDNFNVGGDVTYVDDQQGYYVNALADSLGDAVHLWNIGLRGDINVAGFTLKGDLELQTGSLDKSNGYICPAGEDCDWKGYAFMIGADAKLGNVNLGLEYVYGSGDDDTGDTDLDFFVTSLSATQYGTYVYGYRSSDTASLLGGPGVSNLQRISLYASTKLSKDLGLKGSIHWLKANEDVSINGDTADDDLGWEFDGKVTYNVDRNLKYWIEAGYMAVGDAYNHPDGSSDDMYSVRNGIQLSF